MLTEQVGKTHFSRNAILPWILAAEEHLRSANQPDALPRNGTSGSNTKVFRDSREWVPTVFLPGVPDMGKNPDFQVLPGHPAGILETESGAGHARHTSNRSAPIPFLFAVFLVLGSDQTAEDLIVVDCDSISTPIAIAIPIPTMARNRPSSRSRPKPLLAGVVVYLRRSLMIAFQASMTTRTSTARPIERSRSRNGMAAVWKMRCAAGM